MPSGKKLALLGVGGAIGLLLIFISLLVITLEANAQDAPDPEQFPGTVSVFTCTSGSPGIPGDDTLTPPRLPVPEVAPPTPDRPSGGHWDIESRRFVDIPMGWFRAADSPACNGDYDQLWVSFSDVDVAHANAAGIVLLQWSAAHAAGGTGRPGRDADVTRLDAIEADGWVTTIRILNDAVTNAKLSLALREQLRDLDIAKNAYRVALAEINDEGWVTNLRLADDAVTGRKIAGLTIGGGNIVDNFLEDRHVPSELIDDRMIGADAVGQSELKADAVNTVELVNNAVTEPKLSAAVRTKLNATSSGGGSNVPNSPDSGSADAEYILHVPADGETSWVAASDVPRVPEAGSEVTDYLLEVATDGTGQWNNVDIGREAQDAVSNITPQYINVEPGIYNTSGGDYHLVMHGYPLTYDTSVDSILIRFQGFNVHSESWTFLNGSRVIAFNISATEVLNLARLVGSRTSIEVRVEFRDGGTEVESSRTLNLPIVRDTFFNITHTTTIVPPPTGNTFQGSGLSMAVVPGDVDRNVYFTVSGGQVTWSSSNARDLLMRIQCGTETVGSVNLEANPTDAMGISLSGVYDPTTRASVTCELEWRAGSTVTITSGAAAPLIMRAEEF